MNKTVKRMLSLVLFLVLTAVLAFPCPAREPDKKELHISSTRGFLAFAERCRIDSYSENLSVCLNCDLDLTGKDFQGIPIFLGTFDGQHHKIEGLAITAGGSDLGFIRHLAPGAQVRELALKGSLEPEGSQTQIGGVAGINEGSIVNCSFEGTISGKNSIGGIAGINCLTGVIERCTAKGAIRAEHKIGGIAGENLGVILDCGNLANVNITPQDNTVKVSAITMDTLTGTEDPHTVTDVGGIAGISTGVIRNSSNRGDIGYIHMGYNIGGIAGTQSGLIADCKNYGTVSGRKEAGGIVGQFIPAASIQYEKDTLQILEEQLKGTTSALNQAAYNTQHNMGVIGEGIGMLQEDAATALDALGLLKPESGLLPDPDQILAAKNALEQSMSSLDATMNYLSEATDGTAGQIAGDLRRVAGRVSAMNQTLKKAEETTGATLEDVSDQDTPEDLTGKTAACHNYGPISADINTGGICGAISFEAEGDPEDTLQIEGKRSLNAKGRLRAVILDCENRGTVSGKKIYTGGIVGQATLGLVKNCCNTGKIQAEKAQYAGGIAGASKGSIRACHVKSEIQSSGYAGGIAGSGTLVTDCQSMVILEGVRERQGAILGYQEIVEDREDPVLGNHYMVLGRDPGAIDGTSYREKAEPLDPEAFLSQEDLPDTFRRAKLVFRFEDGEEREITVPVGTKIRDSQVPALPGKDNYTGCWKGLEEIQGKEIYFDTGFPAEYIPNRVTIRTEESRESGRAVLLAEGRFPELEQIRLKKMTPPELPKVQALEAWELPVFSEDQDTVLHYSLPDGQEPGTVQIWVQTEGQAWRPVSAAANGSFLLFPVSPQDRAICAAALPDYSTFRYLGLLFGGLILMGGMILLKKYLNRKKAGKQPERPSQS